MAEGAKRKAGPSRAFRTRDFHRRWLAAHVVAYMAGMVAAFYVNRMTWETTPVFWVQWVALGWGVILAAHGVVFARSTLATMGGGS